MKIAERLDVVLEHHRPARTGIAFRVDAGDHIRIVDLQGEQAAEFFQKEGLQTRQVSELEARRGTQDPLFLVYTYGKLEILQLREDYKKQLGTAYSPRKFHDAFLRHGGAPLKLVRASLLGKG